MTVGHTKRGQEPAYPVHKSNGQDVPQSLRGGLTKRELFAAMAMQGLLADLRNLRLEGFKDRDIDEFAVLRADGLLRQLDARSDEHSNVSGESP